MLVDSGLGALALVITLINCDSAKLLLCKIVVVQSKVQSTRISKLVLSDFFMNLCTISTSEICINLPLFAILNAFVDPHAQAFAELPYGWEKVTDPQFGVYYVE